MADWHEKYTEADYPETHAFLNGGKGRNTSAFEKLTTNAKELNIQLNREISDLDDRLKEAGMTDYSLSSIDLKYTPEQISDPTDGAFAENGGKELYDHYEAIAKELENIVDAINQKHSSPIVDIPVSGAKLAAGQLKNRLNYAKNEYAQYISILAQLQHKIQIDNFQRNKPGLFGNLDSDKNFGGNAIARQNEAAEEKKALKKEVEEQTKKDLKGILTKIDPNENYLNLSFRDQCYIQKNIWPLITLRRGANFDKKTTLPYFEGKGNSSIMCAGEPYAFMNVLASNPSSSDMFQMPHSVLSNLQPIVRFYKVITDRKGKQLDEVEITFPSSTTEQDARDVFKNKRRRGFGIGMKSFEWSMEGSDPFSAKRMIMGKLTIHATTFAEILRDRETKTLAGAPRTFKYADLAIKTGTTALQELSPAACSAQIGELRSDPAYNLNFRLKVVVGYAMPQNIDIRGQDKKMYQQAIRNSFATYDLIPTIHEFNFEEDGRLQFVINYQAYIQDFFDTAYFDIFASANKNSLRLFELRMKKAFAAATNDAKSSTEKDDKDEKDANAIRSLKEANLKSLLTTLFEKRKIYYYDIPYSELNRAMSSTGILPVYDSNEQLKNQDQVRNEINNLKNKASSEENKATAQILKKKIKKLEDNLAKDSHLGIKNSSSFNTDTYRKVGFFFFYDLVDIILENIEASLEQYPKLLGKMKPVLNAEKVKQREMDTLMKTKQNFSKLRVLLGPMEIRDPQSPKTYRHISIGEIPVSVKYFSEWVADKMLNGDRLSYNLSTFIEEFVKNFLSVFLNDDTCGGKRATQPSSFNSTTLTSYADTDLDEITDSMALFNDLLSKPDMKDMWVPQPGTVGFLNTMGSRVPDASRNPGPAANRNWMVFYSGRPAPKSKMAGFKAADNAKGINHYILGQDRGIVKTVRLEKTPAPMLKELRYEQEGYDGLMQLREVYNANVDMFLLPNTFPGQVIFVDPRGFAPDTSEYSMVPEDSEKRTPVELDKFELSRYGIGGYYLIVKASHRIAEGERSTQVIAQWLHSHEKSDGDDSEEGTDIDVQFEQSMKKCRVRKTEQAGGQPTGGAGDVATGLGGSVTANPNMI